MIRLNSPVRVAYRLKEAKMPKFGLAALVALALLPAPAAAQSIPQEERPIDARRRAQGQGQTPSVAATRADLIRGIACQLAAEPASIDPILATAPYSSQEAAETIRILPLLRRCIGARATFTTPPPALRGAIAEAVLKARFATPQAARSPAPGVKPLLDVAAATTRADAATLVTSYGMAQCMAAAHASEVRALLATDPGTPAEAAMFNTTLAPLLGPCAASAGGTGEVRVDGRTLRGVLAESLYRWSVVQRDGTAAPWAAPAAPAAR
jgi:hypothetical protein